MKFFINLTVALLLSGIFASAQTTQNNIGNGKVSGAILDEKSQPFPFVNVLLLQAKDSVLVKGLAADESGKFIFDQVAAGKYLVLVSMVGYQKSYTDVFSVADASINLPVISLKTDIKSLSEVTVIAKKPFIEQQIDRTVVNVENSIVSAGATALEVLERAPGVTVDQQNEQLKLRGKEGVIVQIDGKQTFLSQQELITLLRNTPSDNIEKIELITNPSAKYDAAGNSGIINIKMKRNKNYGTNGNINLGAAYARYGRSNATATINHRAGKISTFISGGAFLNKGFNNNDIYRKIPFENKVTIFDQKTERINKSKYYNVRAGLDYFVNDKTTIGVLVSGFYNNWSSPFGQTNTRILNEDLSLQRTFRTNVYNGGIMNNVSANVNFKHQFNDKGKEMTFDLDFVNYDGKKSSNLDTRYFKPDGQQDGSPETVKNNMPSDINIGVAKLDYAQPLWKGKFETGLKSSLVASDNDMVFEIKTDDWVLDPTRSNRFKYTENVNAAYLNYSGSISKKVKYQLGLRGEHTHSIGNSVTLNQKRDRNYVNLFPSVFLSNQLDTNNVLNLSYSRRIDRPNYQSLNPFEFYLDPYTFQRGNPNLKPQYTNSFQLVHVYKSFLNTTLAYSRIKDMIAEELPQQIASENKTFVTSDNLDNQDNVSLTVSFPIKIAKWWNVQTNFTGVYNHYKSFYLEEQLELKQVSWNMYASNQFTISKTWSGEISGWYNSKAFYGLYAAKPMGMVNAGLQKTILNRKGTLRLNVNDIFWTNRFRGTAMYKDIDFSVKSQWPSRQFRLTFTYNFGNQNVKGARQRNTGSDDLQKRANGGS
ncbi:outer membrane beta-barrel protein [Dyadobacter arcticus]|uniref:Outer membrane receptor protein involved in Fe transport n=1 Tax=Dyadobacter arcticus TaxID=1078754 RepID=A0ABX0UNN8_9BACT|nr:outer membrane beta-barrel protein [Dyadobacter arcticus]NIJ53280.1 outer membrane receptor protein involved in Fe transport [Dyadobacter arcticus]